MNFVDFNTIEDLGLQSDGLEIHTSSVFAFLTVKEDDKDMIYRGFLKNLKPKEQ